MTTQHTPAPWEVLSNQYGVYVKSKSNEFIAQMVGDFNREDKTNHAKLIAAAPELLEALIACNDAMEYMSEYDIPIMLPQQVKDAIAKATQ